MFFKGILLLSMLLWLNTVFASNNPCMDAPQILNVVDRPSHTDSACSMPTNKMMIESGYQYQKLGPGGGWLYNFPNSQIRFGLEKNSEIFLYVPSYNHESYFPFSGFNGSLLGVKHQFITNSKVVFTGETVVVLPDGSAAFGAQQTGIVANAILTYIYNDLFDLTLMLGAYDVSLPRYYDGIRFSSVNGNLMLSYALNGKTDMFAELYGQTHVGPMLGGGVSMDIGVMYEARSNIAIDLAVGQNLNGYIGSVERYITSGISFMF